MQERPTVRLVYLIWLALVLASVSGCISGSITPTAPTQNGTIASTAPYLVRWQGEVETGTQAGVTTCKQLNIVSTEGPVLIGGCEGTLNSVEPLGTTLERAAEFGKLLGRIEYKSSADQLSFFGAGEVTDEVWQRALVQWSRLKFAEHESGHVCAACPTVISWFLAEGTADPGICRHVFATSFGFVTAENIKCHPQGDAPQQTASGWLTTTELQTLDDWLYARGRFQDADNYFTGQGEQAVSVEDRAAMEEWAQQVYRRLLP
jgi:hypothetical protein